MSASHASLAELMHAMQKRIKKARKSEGARAQERERERERERKREREREREKEREET